VLPDDRAPRLARFQPHVHRTVPLTRRGVQSLPRRHWRPGSTTDQDPAPRARPTNGACNSRGHPVSGAHSPAPTGDWRRARPPEQRARCSVAHPAYHDLKSRPRSPVRARARLHAPPHSPARVRGARGARNDTVMRCIGNWNKRQHEGEKAEERIERDSSMEGGWCAERRLRTQSRRTTAGCAGVRAYSRCEITSRHVGVASQNHFAFTCDGER